MFIRNRPYKRKDGKKCNSFALIESYRKNGTSKHRTLLNLGQNFNIPRSQWGELIHCVAARLKGESNLLCCQKDETILKAVDDIVAQLQRKGYDIQRTVHQRYLIFPEQTTHPDSRTIGGERLILQTLEQLGLAALLRSLTFSEKQVKLCCALIVGRMLHPGSERKTHQWLCETSSVLQLLDLEPPSLNTLYRCTDLIHEHMDEILDGLFGITKAVLQFEDTVVFYDLTNTYYDGKEKGKLLLPRAQTRSDCPLVTLALTMDASGFPRNVQTLPGNAGEPATLKEAIGKLRGAKPTVIMDSGIATEQNLQYLKEQGLYWITVERSITPPVPENKPDQQFETAGGVKIKAWKVTKEEKDVEDIAELRVFVHSGAKQAKEDQILETLCKKFVKALTTLHEGLSKPRNLTNIDEVTIKVGSLKEKYKKVSHLYEVEVNKKEGTKHAASVTVTKRASHVRRTQVSGGYVLRTSHTGWSVETVARTYWRLTEIERTFRVMKSDLGLRPIYHSTDERIEGHLFITVLAYHAAHLVRTRLKQHGIHDSWATIRDKLNRIRRITTRTVKDRYRHLITEMDQDLPPSVVQFFAVLGYVYDPDATRTVTEHVEKGSPPVSQKPPDS